MWTDGAIKWQMWAVLVHALQQRVAAGRFALIKASTRLLYSSRGPLDVKTLKAGSRGRRKNTTVRRLNWITQKMTKSSLFEQITTTFFFPQSAKKMRRPCNKHCHTTNTKGRKWQTLIHQPLTEVRITTGSEGEGVKSDQTWHKKQKGFIRGRVIDRGCNTQLDLCSFVLR